ncbi:hypothetical protein ACFE04_016777 [Oxalis oulophora]
MCRASCYTLTEENRVTTLGPTGSTDSNAIRRNSKRPKYRVVNFNEIEKHYKDLVRSCRFWEGRVNADKRRNSYLLEKQQNFGISIAEIIAWKNDHKLNVHLKALIGLNKKRNLERKNKEINKLPSLMQSPKECHASEWRGQRQAILDMEEANNNSEKFLGLESGELSRRHGRRYIQPSFWHEIGAIKERRQAWLGSSNTSPDEQQMKWLMHDTIRLMCIVKEVAPKALEGVRAKIKELEEEKKITTHSQIKLADFELRKKEVEIFMRNWD